MRKDNYKKALELVKELEEGKKMTELAKLKSDEFLKKYRDELEKMKKVEEEQKFFQKLFSLKLSPELFKKFSELAYKESGIYLKENKLMLLANRLRKRLMSLRLGSYEEYYEYLQEQIRNGNLDELVEFLDVISTNETYFFRNTKHFLALQNKIIPTLIEKRKKTKHIRIWSAGCSTGEEPYSIAIVIAEHFRDILKDWHIEIIGSDIAQSVLSVARKGCYKGRSIQKVPFDLLSKFFYKVDDAYCLSEEIKRLVVFTNINLFKDPYPTNVDIIFCRNVMIYFDRQKQVELLEKLYKVIKKDGYLFIGHSETLYMITDKFRYKEIEGSPVYIPNK
jgi:chemotaxis protein methyltransferase CheR